MLSHRSRRTLAVSGTVLLLVIATAGCGRRADPAGADAATSGTGAPAPTAIALETSAPVTAEPDATTPGPTAEPGPTEVPAATPQPTAAPLATPDLTAIQHLLDDLDAALGADATADTDEGSAN
jgi:hypothetical protein